MLKQSVVTVMVVFLSLIALESGGVAESFDYLYGVIEPEISVDRAYEYVGCIWQYDKWCTLPMWNRSAREVQSIMRARGFDEALVIDTPADGVTKHGDWTNPVGWDCTQATLEIVSPSGLSDDERHLCNWRVDPTGLAFFSCPTPPGGVEAELVVLEKPTPEALAKIDARGKIVLVSSRAGYLKKYLPESGALGIVSDQAVGPHDDANIWLNTWSDQPGGWMMTADDSRDHFCFSISRAKGRRLRHMIARGEKVVLKAVIDSRYYMDGSLPYVTGAVHGTGDQEVWIGGHLFEWGANDNATGCAVMLESVGTLKALVESGALPRPKRTIRVWMGQEMYGSLPFTERYMDNLRRTVAAVCCDTPAADRDLNAATVRVFMNPHSCPTYVDALYPEFWREYYRRIRVKKPIFTEPFEGGTDTYFAEPMIGAPTTFVYMENGTWLHHTSLDTIDKVDKRSLRDLCVVNALYLYYMANAGYDELSSIAELTFNHGVDVIHAETSELTRKAVDCSDGAVLGHLQSEGVRRIQYITGLQREALQSILRLMEAEKKRDAERSLNGYADDIQAIGDVCAERLKRAVKARSKESGTRIVAYKRKKTDRDKTEASLYPKALKPGTLTLEGIPSSEWVGVSHSPRWWSPRNWAAASYWWADGSRSLAEIRDVMELEANRDSGDFDLIGYYGFLERYGYVEVEKK